MLRKIGKNEVVLNAINQLIPYCSDALFVLLVPDNKHTINNFFQNKLKIINSIKFQNGILKIGVISLGKMLKIFVIKTV